MLLNKEFKPNNFMRLVYLSQSVCLCLIGVDPFNDKSIRLGLFYTEGLGNYTQGVSMYMDPYDC